MSEAVLSPNKRRHDDAETPRSGVTTTTKRRAFLQTMGQQLREIGTEGTSPQDNSRTTFGTSPNIRPASRATAGAGNPSSTSHVDTPESDGAPGEDDQLPAGAAKSASRWLWRPDEVLIESVPGLPQQVVFEDLLDWSQSYFDNWHPAFPFLHAPSILDHFRLVTPRDSRLFTGSLPNPLQHVITRAILSISTFDRRQMCTPQKAVPPGLVFHSFNDAINSIQPVLTEESSILSLQAIVSVQLFLITMHRYNAASRLQGLASRILFQLGLHKCPTTLQSPSSKETELRKRLFWCVFCIDRYICIRLGIPMGVRSDEVDVCYPHAERHTGAENAESGHDNRLDLLEYLARHASIRGSIMETRHKIALRAPINETERVLEVDADHTKWWNNVDDHLSDDDRTDSISKAHQVVLIVLRFESILALHRSILATSKKGAQYNAALQRCISASRSIINILHKALKGVGAFDGSPGQNGYEKTPLLWPSFTWAVWMSTFICFSAAAEGQMKHDVLLKLVEKSIQILNHLALRGTNWPEACVVAIQNLKTKLETPSTRSSTVSSNARSRASAGLSALGTFSGARAAQQSRPLTADGRALQRQYLGHLGSYTTGSGAVYDNSLAHPQMSTVTVRNMSMSDGPIVSSNYPNDMTLEGTETYPPTYLGGPGTFLGIAQQTSDNPLPNEQIMHLFNNEDMSYWLGNDLGMNQNFGFD